MNYLKVEDLTLEKKLGMLLCARRWDEQEDIDLRLNLLKIVLWAVFRFRVMKTRQNL